ncbi:hypothetical protein UFOVP411_30 [uncultured Caudovirales phage]|uniref:Uncharacterized protein n=1 Tax=uncultured Caudovirales phage TaxID=2100421 RepID=A0A6J5M326_9CAUD|nr:hypothetical protein UFOVP411_30 [uncultured Caudovirales phage]
MARYRTPDHSRRPSAPEDTPRGALRGARKAAARARKARNDLRARETLRDALVGPYGALGGARVEPVEPVDPPGLLTGANGTEEARTDLVACLLEHRIARSPMSQRPTDDLGYVGSFKVLA